MSYTRRKFIKSSSAGLLSLAGAHAADRAAASAESPGEIQVHVTAGTRRFARRSPLEWRSAGIISSPAITIDPSKTFQTILGFGAAFTDAACYMCNQLSPDACEKLFHELFHPSEMGLSVCRMCIGASDYARQVYSYDEGGPDPQLRRFSIDHDREYIIPMLKLARSTNPNFFLLASPWSPPAWMKVNGSMLGGLMEKKHFPVYAKYLAKFVQAYAGAGVPVNAITIQNEVDTEQDGRMPASLWGQEYEIGFVSEHLGREFAENKIATKIWILDHNYNLWGRAICELDDPELNRYVDGVAWHGYMGQPSAMTRVHEAHPEKHMYWTEGGPDLHAPDYLTDWNKWGAMFAGILRNWARCIIGWNLALDEQGKPNIGPFECGGVITIDSRTKEVTRSGQYWALAHYSRGARCGALRVESGGEIEGVSHVAFANPDGSKVVIVTNAGPDRQVSLRIPGREAQITLPENSITNLNWV